MNLDQPSVAVLWDVENVNPGDNSSIIESIVDYAARFGRVTVAVAFANWSNNRVTHCGNHLAALGFQLIHVPKARKNSADVSLVAYGTELLILYPHLKVFVLVTGDADFRPLLTTVRRRGASSVVVCDARSANEDLLTMADEYADYRQLEDTDVAEPDRSNGGTDGGENGGRQLDPVALSREGAFLLLKEAANRMLVDKRIPRLGPLKIRMRLLNEAFDEGALGYRSWKQFVLAAAEAGFVRIEEVDSDLAVQPAMDGAGGTLPPLPEPIVELLRAVAAKDGKRGSDEWKSFGQVNQELLQRGVDYKTHGYRQFKKLVEAAEKRGVVETSNRKLDWFIRVSRDGESYLQAGM